MNTSSDRFLRVLAISLLFCFAAMLLSSPLAAQSTFGSISGTVLDASGSAIADVQVTLTSVATSAKQTFTTGPDGLYSFVNLNPGEYSLEAEKTGFKHFKRESVIVQVQQAVRIDVPMELGAVNQTIEVTAETPLLQPTNASLGQVIDQRATNEIPLNGRNVFNLITLSPAAVECATARFTAVRRLARIRSAGAITRSAVRSGTRASSTLTASPSTLATSICRF